MEPPQGIVVQVVASWRPVAIQHAARLLRLGTDEGIVSAYLTAKNVKVEVRRSTQDLDLEPSDMKPHADGIWGEDALTSYDRERMYKRDRLFTSGYAPDLRRRS